MVHVFKGNRMSDKDHYEQAISWESDMLAKALQSESRAWNISKIAVLLVIIAIIGSVFVMFEKRAQVFLIKENAETGAVETISSITNMSVAYEEVRDKYWLTQYVRARERYDWQTLQTDYDMIGLMSNEDVGREYAANFEGDDALDKKFGEFTKARIEINSRSVDGRGTGTIRFEKVITNTKNSAEKKSRKWIATITYEYQPANWEKESDRMINPFGFTVTSYRVDPES